MSTNLENMVPRKMRLKYSLYTNARSNTVTI